MSLKLRAEIRCKKSMWGGGLTACLRAVLISSPDYYAFMVSTATGSLSAGEPVLSL